MEGEKNVTVMTGDCPTVAEAAEATARTATAVENMMDTWIVTIWCWRGGLLYTRKNAVGRSICGVGGIDWGILYFLTYGVQWHTRHSLDSLLQCLCIDWCMVISVVAAQF